ncbi:tetratricopeptide repeat protein [Rarobacter incanus]|uniref:Tetratricopeptide repeat protein n=1 Tax=Rarobacter incanus TaxID=153494 RepID=A0A542SLV0_9MICO|nr:tetratricopeptide repeat protein [Rarobacter incanus]TQK75455.1 tetratricopeptide repeat protein [Rarobacter incanus]
MRKLKAILPAAFVTALLAIYLWAVQARAMTLIQTGNWAGIGIGVAALALPVIIVVFVVREIVLAIEVQRMADQLAAAGELPTDDLPRSPGGRIDRDAADAAFIAVREQVERDPDNWKCWYHLAFAYEAAGDKTRARQTLRKAAGMWRVARRASGRSGEK